MAKDKVYEEDEQLAVCEYMRNKYPEVIFSTDHSGLRVSQGLANKIKKGKSSNGIPDLNIDEPRGGWYGLRIEMKATGKSPFRLTGMLKNDEHLRTQWRMLASLTIKGYYSGFCVGYKQAVDIIDWYMSLPPTE